jgi:hypothetical protein
VRRFIVLGIVLLFLSVLIVVKFFTSRKIRPQNAVDCAAIPDKSKRYAFKQYIEDDGYPMYCFCKARLFADWTFHTVRSIWFKNKEGNWENPCMPKIFW